MNLKAKWIVPADDPGDICPEFSKSFQTTPGIKRASLLISAMGVYEAVLNGQRISDYVLAPGWTSYKKRHQYQNYDITEMLGANNLLSVGIGRGWYSSPLAWPADEVKEKTRQKPRGLIAEITIEYLDGAIEKIPTDQSWACRESKTRFSEIYDGEVYDASLTVLNEIPVTEYDKDLATLIPQEGEAITEQEHIMPLSCFQTPKGETVIDFGQNLTGYLSFMIDGKNGERIEISHAEVMDKDGNFYTENYRAAKAKIHYTCSGGLQSYKPKFTFFGFRYIRLDAWPETLSEAALGTKAFLQQFTAIAVNSEMKRTGYIKTSDDLLNKLFENIIWGQKGNFLDIPTDCPQRDERLGWTGDAEVFVKTASYNFDVERFFLKWLQDLSADQYEDGRVPHVIPDALVPEDKSSFLPSAAWADAAVICPWIIYKTYGRKRVLKQSFDSMKKWIDYITEATTIPYLWTGGEHFSDWLGLDAPQGSYKGSSRQDLIASAYYAYSVSLFVKTGKTLGVDLAEYEALYGNIVKTFRETYPTYETQTEMTLAVYFELAEDLQKTADMLADKIVSDGIRLMTGFVGTPYILHALSRYGHTELAYSLLLRTEYPSWLYPVTKGATTIWEHWDGIMPDGNFWSRDMNSYNHYAYGAVADWMYEEAAGIKPLAPGFEKLEIAPKPDPRLGFFEASIDTRHGTVRSKWIHTEGKVKYEILTPAPAKIIIDGAEYNVPAGSYIYYS